MLLNKVFFVVVVNKSDFILIASEGGIYQPKDQSTSYFDVNHTEHNPISAFPFI